MLVVLGINAFHADSAACLLVDGRLMGAVAEERLGDRVKHTSHFPVNAITRLLADNGLRLRDVTHVAVARDASANRGAKLRYAFSHPWHSAGAVLEHLRRGKRSDDAFLHLAEMCGEDPTKVSFKVIGVEHHLAHISSAYYLSPFDSRTAGFSYDASGDFVSMMAAECEGSKIKVLDKVVLPDSLGFFYTALCQYIGFDQFGEEYKVMGLAPYGEDRFSELMKKLVPLNDSSWFGLNKHYFGMHQGGESGGVDESQHIKMGQLYSDRLVSELGPARQRQNPLTQREMDIARSTQVRFEEAAIHCMTKLEGLVRSEQLAMAGGSALNGVANARIHRETSFSNQYIQPAASDDGGCLGAAYWCWHNVIGAEERFHMKHAFWGPDYADHQLYEVARRSSFYAKSCSSDEELVQAASRLIADGLVVGWYQGRSEWGPRALGNRSILANPAISTMKDTINAKIKRRESFRPFAPSVLKESMSTYFEQDINSPFMQHVVKIRKEWRDRLPAVTHVDGTGRLQTVDKESNPLYHSLISALEAHTGIGMVLNTSFNENEPIVDSPKQAYDCFVRTDMDALCLGRHILTKAN